MFTRQIFAIFCLGWFVVSGGADEPLKYKPIGVNYTSTEDSQKLTVDDVLKGLSLDESKLECIDEPPFKLRELACEATLRNTKIKVQVRIRVVYTLDLFSVERKWNPKSIRAATVSSVSITPIGADK